MLDEYYLRERGTDCYCPGVFDKDGYLTNIMTGMNILGTPPGKVVGEFWYEPDGSISVAPIEEVDNDNR